MSTIVPVGMDLTTGLFKIAAIGDTMDTPAMIGLGGIPTLTINANAGTGATASISGNNIAGKITLTSGTLSIASGLILTLNYADGLTFPNGSNVVFSPGNAAFAGIVSTLSVVGNTTNAQLSASVGVGIGTTYIGYYHVSGW